MIKKLLILAVVVGAAYGAWWYMNEVAKKTEEKQGTLKKSQKVLEEMDAEDRK